MASVRLENIVKSYGKVPVLHDVNLEIADGEFVTLVGPSGCGKSTLLRMIAGLEEITGGTMTIGDRVVNDLAPKQRDIAMVFQSYALYPHMSVYKNMAFSMKMRGADATETHRVVSEAARILGLEPLLNRLPGQLSGGQRQRVAMGRAIVRNPQVFLFDEPLSNLDAKLRVQMRAEIKSLHQRLGTTIVYVTHDQVEAMTMADRIVVMQGGHIQQVGSPLDLFDRPANQFVASFIGSPAMNLLAGRIEGDVLVSGNARLPLPTSAASGPGDVIYGIRPEYITLDHSGLGAKVLLVEPMGSETQVTVALDGLTLTCLFRERVEMRPGDLIGIGIPLDQVHLFDAATGDRLEY